MSPNPIATKVTVLTHMDVSLWGSVTDAIHASSVRNSIEGLNILVTRAVEQPKNVFSGI